MEDYGKTAEENITPQFYEIHGDDRSALKEAENVASSGSPRKASFSVKDSVKNSQHKKESK